MYSLSFQLYVERLNAISNKTLFKFQILEQDKLCLNYKISIPAQIDPGSERSLQPCMLPPSWTHIHGIVSFSTNDIYFDLEICGLFSSIVMDYFVKASGKSNFLKNVITSMPMPTDKEGFLAQLLIARVLVLNSRNSLYYDLLDSYAGQINTTKEYKKYFSKIYKGFL